MSSRRRARPTIAVSMGDPGGIGPEVALRAIAKPRVRRKARFVLVGDPVVIEATAGKLGLSLPRSVEIVDASPDERRDWRLGTSTPWGARAAYAAIHRAVDLVLGGEADAVTTAPVSKAAIQNLGIDFPGHTEIIAKRARARVRMMMAGSSLRVVLVTTHVALARVPELLKPRDVVETAQIASDALRRFFGVREPRLALAGLNPHAGEGGAFGDEEKRILAPALRTADRRGLRLEGPFPPDTLFHEAVAKRQFDAVVALYHDQGLIPFKLLHFHDGVNVTIGLPFPRTSPDHGTAWDIAGKGKASPESMAAALALAAKMSKG